MRITLTGADERTSVESLIALADRGAEIGLLFTTSPDGRKRYPEREWILNIVKILGPARCALHVCGGRARTELCDGRLDEILQHVGRIQVNGPLWPRTVAGLCEQYPGHIIITQHNEQNEQLAGIQLENHALLVDGSGGTGIRPAAWVRPVTDKAVGFAGGLGAGNMLKELPKIAAVATEPSWVDMESALRNADDWFDPLKANGVMTCFEAWKAGQR